MHAVARSGKVDVFMSVGATNDPEDPLVGKAGGTHTITPKPSAFGVWLFLGAIMLAVAANSGTSP